MPTEFIETSQGLVATLSHICSSRTRKSPFVVFLHGNSACKEVFVQQIEHCAANGISTIAVDLPGHGASPWAENPEATYNLPAYARTIRDVLDVFSTRFSIPDMEIVLVGWSLGGHVALELMADPVLARGVMIIGTPPVAMSIEGVAEGFNTTPTMQLAFKDHFTEEEAYAYAQAMVGDGVELTPDFIAQVKGTDGRARLHLAASGSAGIGTDERKLVNISPTPLAVVHGCNDPFVNYSYLESLPYRNLWRGQVIVLQSGHAPHLEIAPTLNALVTEFVSDVSAPATVE